MIGYATVGTNDLAKATAYYEALLAEIGASKVMGDDRIVLYSNDPSQGFLGVCIPNDAQPATVGNGTMAGIKAGSNDAVDRLHAKALELGGGDEGAPGDRGNGFYAGYFRDLDGNKLVAYHLTLG